MENALRRQTVIPAQAGIQRGRKPRLHPAKTVIPPAVIPAQAGIQRRRRRRPRSPADMSQLKT